MPEIFFSEAVNALNGWGQERGVWNLSFWDFSMAEIKEVMRVLENTLTLNKIVMASQMHLAFYKKLSEDQDDDRRYESSVENQHLTDLMKAVIGLEEENVKMELRWCAVIALR